MASKTLLEQIQTAPESAQPRSLWRLLIVTSAALYLEIVLIRWIGTEVKIFAFFQNLSLITCFLGFGVGCFNAHKRGSLIPSLAATSTIVVAASLRLNPWHDFLRSVSAVLSYTSDGALWSSAVKVPLGTFSKAYASSLLIVAMFLFLICIAMIPLGRWVGFYLETIPNTVSAYSVNLLGSVLGIWLLAILAFMWLSPSYWFVVAFALVLFAQPFSWRDVLVGVALLGITLLELKPGNETKVYWSPYQKLSVAEAGNQQYNIDVNNEGYMTIANLSPAALAGDPRLASSYRNSSYDSPFQFAQSVNRVLVIGAGAGNDIAAALRHGASQIDAVEIDPVISTLGARLHPEHPYSSPKVHLITNDARNFLRQSHDKYDVIIFGLLDSHTEFSGYSNVRVDNYVYTEQSFLEAKRLLGKDGILVLKFEVRSPWTWMGQRFYGMLASIFPHPPLTYYCDQVGALLQGTVFIESNDPSLWQKSAGAQQASFVSEHPPAFPLSAENAPPPTTDDWPYVYNRGRFIPRAYFAVSTAILALALYMAGPFFEPKEKGTWQFFLLGAGFLLMETQLVSRLALYFGTTWLVNCIALTGILTVLLLANFYVQFRRPEKLGICYACLCAALGANYLIPFASIPGSGRLVGTVVCVAYCVPFFFAGVIFTETFRSAAGSSKAFGANMLGAVAGGLAQNLSFVFGMKALLLIAVVVYSGAAFLQIMKPRFRTSG
jgi:spermidine synthase